MKKLKVNFTTIPNDAILDKRLDTYEFRVAKHTKALRRLLIRF